MLLCMISAGDAFAGTSRPLAAAVIRGSTVYTPTDFYAVYRPRLGKDADAASARAVIDDIESLYQRDGYLRPRIQVWDDLLADGMLRIDLHEIWLVDVAVQGDAGPYAGKIKDATQALMTELPLRAVSIPEALRMLRALPGLELDANVAEQPGANGGVILNLKAAYHPVKAEVQWSNRSSEEVGPNLVSAQVVENNLLHAGERIGVFATAAVHTSEYHAVGGFVELPVGRESTLLSLSGFHANSRPSLNGTQYDMFHPQDSVNLALSQWLVRHDRLRLSVGLGASYQNSEITFDGVELEVDRLRAAELNLRLEGQAGGGAYGLSMGWRKGSNALGARIAFVDGSGLSPAYDIGSISFAYTAPLGDHWRWRMEVLGQSSSRSLPYVEQFKVGGIQLGRGLSTAMLAGDSGAGGKFELTYFIGGLPRWLGNPSLFTYTDYGAVWQRSVTGRQYISTAGLGLQSRFPWGRLAAEVGKPIAFSGSRPAGTSVFGEAQFRF